MIGILVRRGGLIVAMSALIAACGTACGGGSASSYPRSSSGAAIVRCDPLSFPPPRAGCELGPHPGVVVGAAPGGDSSVSGAAYRLGWYVCSARTIPATSLELGVAGATSDQEIAEAMARQWFASEYRAPAVSGCLDGLAWRRANPFPTGRYTFANLPAAQWDTVVSAAGKSALRSWAPPAA